MTSLYQKLYQIRQKLGYIQKTASGHRFKYADEAAILALLRPAMDEFGVLLEFEMEEPKDVGSGVIQCPFVFTWINVDNPEERIVKRLYLQTVPGDPQKMGGLMTYANRYFLYKYFNIPTAELDIDAFHNHADQMKAKQEVPKISPEQLADLEAMAEDYPEVSLHALSVVNLKSWDQLPADRFDKAKSYLDSQIAKFEKENQ